MVVSRVFLCALLFLCASCAASPKPLTGLVPGKELRTLQSAVTVSVRQGPVARGARGYVVYQSPARFHLSVLAPFGQTLMDLYSADDRFLCIIPSRRTAYAGHVAELPEQEGVRLWGLMRWVVEGVEPAPAQENLAALTKQIGHEQVFFDEQGLVRRRVTESGDQVTYDDYATIDGLPFPFAIELSDRLGTKVSMRFDEPEVNLPIEESALIPSLENITVLPFTSFRGF